MSETQFTPGPWSALLDGNEYNSAVVVTSKDGWICEVFDDSEACALPDDANANLIKESPAMYAVIEKQIAWIGHWQRDFEAGLKPTDGSLAEAKAELFTALKRARGEA